MDHYIFSASANSYFLGRDLIVTLPGNGGSVRVNEKNGMLSVNVKDSMIFNDYPADVKRAIEQIGEDRSQTLYELEQADFWRCAENDATKYGFHVYQEGRTGGWLAVDGTQRIDVVSLIEPDEEDVELRDKFLKFAFEQAGAISHFRESFYRAVKEAADAPEPKPSPEPVTEPLKVFLIAWIEDGKPRAGIYRNIPALVAEQGDESREFGERALASPGERFPYTISGWDTYRAQISFQKVAA